MAKKIDVAEMARNAHASSLQERQDGGPGSGKKKGGGKDSSKEQGKRVKKLFGQLKPGGGLLTRNTTGLGVKKKN